MSEDSRICDKSCPYFHRGQYTKRDFCYKEVLARKVLEVKMGETCFYGLKLTSEEASDVLENVVERTDKRLSGIIGKSLRCFLDGGFTYLFRPDLHK